MCFECMVFSFLLRIQKKHLQKHGDFRCELWVHVRYNNRSKGKEWNITLFIVAIFILFYKHRRKFGRYAILNDEV